MTDHAGLDIRLELNTQLNAGAGVTVDDREVLSMMTIMSACVAGLPLTTSVMVIMVMALVVAAFVVLAPCPCGLAVVLVPCIVV